MRKFLTTEQLLEIWELRGNNKGIERYAASIGFNPISAKNATKYLKDFILGERGFGKMTPKAYIKAVRIIRKANKSLPETREETPAEGGGNLERLEKAMAVFQETVAEVILSEVEARSQERVKQKEKELAIQKEKYEQELLRLQAIIAEAKNSSITGLIKKKWMTL